MAEYDFSGFDGRALFLTIAFLAVRDIRVMSGKEIFPHLRFFEIINCYSKISSRLNNFS